MRRGRGPSDDDAIVVEAISKRISNRSVLDRISFSVAPGEWFALLGPSGSGKSTLLRIISGIECGDEGRIWIEGEEVTHSPAHVRRVHTVFQHYALFPHLDVQGNVAFPLRVARLPLATLRARVHEALAWMGLDRLASRPVNRLSGGERQRVALARALVMRPKCLLLDEPLSALDPHLRDAMSELLERVQAEFRLAYVYVTHDRQEALRTSHRIGVLRDGRLEQIGTPRELYDTPATDFVASFVGPINWFEGAVSESPERCIRLGTGHAVRGGVGCRQEGHHLRIGVRPQDILFTGPEGLPALVIGSEFLGNGIRVKLQTIDGTSVAAVVPPRTQVPATGSSVFLTWNASAAHVFDE